MTAPVCALCHAVPVFEGDDGVCEACLRADFLMRVQDPLHVQGRVAFYLGALDADRIDETGARALLQMMRLKSAELKEQLIALALHEAGE